MDFPPTAAAVASAQSPAKLFSGSAGHTPSEGSAIQPCGAWSGPQSSAPQSVGVSACYVFKSRLQEYAQKVGISTPEYDTVKEGPSHDPVFRSTVTVNSVRYDSLPGFFNRKAAEQSAAEVALTEIYKSGYMTENIPTVHESGLCKNMLQEYAQKMNYAIPSYLCSKQPSGLNPFICTVEIGGIRYIGAAARTKKEAEIKAARTALLAIQRSSETASNGASQYTVLPCKKKVMESQPETTKKLKPKKPSLKKKWPKKRRFPRNKDNNAAQSNNDEPGNGQDGGASRVAGADIEANTGHQQSENMGQQQFETLIWNESEQAGKMKGEPGTPPKEFQMSAMETNGYCQNVQQVGSGFSYTEQASFGGVDSSTSLKVETS